MGHFDTIKFSNNEVLATTAAQEWLKILRARSGSAASYSVALAGGRIAVTFFTAVAKLAQNKSGVLDAVHFFWGDERCVPPNDPESNFGLARDHLLIPLAVPDSRIHRIRGEKSPDAAATAAEKDLCGFAAASPDGQPLLDLIFLGMGEDGHVASLFPSAPEKLTGSKRVYLPVTGPKPPPRRITLGYAAIAAAREVWVLISGQDKEQALHDSIRETGTTPLARVLKSRAHTKIFTDIS